MSIALLSASSFGWSSAAADLVGGGDGGRAGGLLLATAMMLSEFCRCLSSVSRTSVSPALGAHPAPPPADVVGGGWVPDEPADPQAVEPDGGHRHAGKEKD